MSSAHYLIDQFTSPLTTSKIIDVRSPGDGKSRLGGNFVVRVPDFAPIQLPSNLGDLVTKKYAAILAFYAGVFTNIASDDLLDTSGLDLAAPNKFGKFGARSTVALSPLSGIVETVNVPLAGPAPEQAIVHYEVFKYNDTDAKTDRFVREYEEVVPSSVQCSASFNGGGSYSSVSDGMVLNVVPAKQGTSLRLRFENPTNDVLYVGSWAVIY